MTSLDHADRPVATDGGVATDGRRTRHRWWPAEALDGPRAAVAILTRLPVGATVDGDVVGAASFPIVGALIGGLAALPLVFLGSSAPWVAAILAVAILAVATGALHLDGLADTADALVAADPQSAERARKDPAIGAGGAVALIVVIGLDVAAIAAIAGSSGGGGAGLAVVAAATGSRWIPVALAAVRPTRSEPPAKAGFGTWFAARVGPSDVALASIAALIFIGTCAWAAGGPALALAGAGSAVVALLGATWIRSRRSGLDGDLLGASVEIGFAAILVAIVASTAIGR